MAAMVAAPLFPSSSGRCGGGALRRHLHRGLWSSSRSKSHLRMVVRSQWRQEVLWASAPVAEVSPAAEQLFHVVLDVGSNSELKRGHTKAGQFVQIKLEDSKPAFLAIASPPATAAKGYLEFLVKDVQGTTASALCGLTKGDTVDISQVMGSGFKIEEAYPSQKYQTLLLFATGSGISPIRSLLESGIDAAKRTDVRLFYGIRNLQRLAYKEKFKQWEAEGVKIVPVLSQPEDGWTGETGYIQSAFANSNDGLDGTRTAAFLCGHKDMTKDVTELLAARGVAPDKILLNF